MGISIDNQQGQQPLRFDEFVARHRIVVTPVPQFQGFAVSVVLPPDWEPFDAAHLPPMPGNRVWTWPADPLIAQFGANAVLSMSQAESPVDPSAVFDMLCEWQLHMVEGSRERHRSIAPAVDGSGVIGNLTMEIPSEYGLIGSESITRIVATATQTLIAQLTISALIESPVDAAHIRLIVEPAATGPDLAVHPGGRPVPLQR